MSQARLTVSIPNELLSDLQRRARAEDRSVSSMTVHLLRGCMQTAAAPVTRAPERQAVARPISDAEFVGG